MMWCYAEHGRCCLSTLRILLFLLIVCFDSFHQSPWNPICRNIILIGRRNHKGATHIFEKWVTKASRRKPLTKSFLWVDVFPDSTCLHLKLSASSGDMMSVELSTQEFYVLTVWRFFIFLVLQLHTSERMHTNKQNNKKGSISSWFW